jgi:pantetheine-phosphate adenylyltransferase
MVHVALGGTFEIVHKGHRTLLAKAFEIGDRVLIGLTSDRLANSSRSRNVLPYDDREKALRAFVDRTYPGSDYTIRNIDDRFGPAIHLEDLDVLVVSVNTHPTGIELNHLRREKGLRPLDLVAIPPVLADDGLLISSTRVMARECDADGHVPS